MKRLLTPWYNRAVSLYQGLRISFGTSGDLRLIYDIAKLGLFAHLNAVAYQAVIFSRSARRFSVECRNDSYTNTPGQDWFGRLFIDLDPVSRSAPEVRFTRADRLPNHWECERLGLEEGRRGFFAKFEIAPHLVREASDFATAHFAQARVLGVHYRGTDKSSEAPRIGYESVLAHIQRRLERERYDRIFLATDEEKFTAFISERSPVPVILQPSVQRSTCGEAIHLAKKGDRLRQAEQALIDCQLLARCQGLTKTASTLSGWALVLNPSLSVELLNPPHPKSCYFPDREIVRRAQKPVLVR